MVPIVGVGDVHALDLIQLNLKPVALHPGVIDRVEIVDAAVGSSGPRRRRQQDARP